MVAEVIIIFNSSFLILLAEVIIIFNSSFLILLAEVIIIFNSSFLISSRGIPSFLIFISHSSLFISHLIRISPSSFLISLRSSRLTVAGAAVAGGAAAVGLRLALQGLDVLVGDALGQCIDAASTAAAGVDGALGLEHHVGAPHVLSGVELVGVGLAPGADAQLEGAQVGYHHAVGVLQQRLHRGAQLAEHGQHVGALHGAGGLHLLGYLVDADGGLVYGLAVPLAITLVMAVVVFVLTIE